MSESLEASTLKSISCGAKVDKVVVVKVAKVDMVGKVAIDRLAELVGLSDALL